MTKAYVTVIISLLLLLWLALHDMPAWLRQSSSSDNSHSLERRPQTAKARDRQPLEESRPTVSKEDMASGDLPTLPIDVTDSSSFPLPTRALAPIDGILPIDSIHFIRSSDLLASEDANHAVRARLHRTVSKLVGSGLRNRIILDADAVDPEGSPIVIYANPKFDLTKHAIRIYAILSEYDRLIGTESVEQGIAPNQSSAPLLKP